MQRGAVRVLDVNGIPFDVPLGVFTAALPLMSYDSASNSFKGVAVPGGGAPTGPAGGDLAGTYPNPTVTQARGLLETSGPTTLAMAGVAASQMMVRSAATIIGIFNSAFLPGGSFTLFPGTWGTDDSVLWQPFNFLPRYRSSAVLSGAGFTVPGVGLGTVTGLSRTVPRVGTYFVDITLSVAQTVALSTFGCALAFSGTATAVALQANIPNSQTTTPASRVQTSFPPTAMVGAATQAVGVTVGIRICGFVVVSVVGTFDVQAQRSAATTVIGPGSGFSLVQL